MFRSTTSKKNFGYIRNLLNSYNFTRNFDETNDYYTYSLRISVSKLKELLSKNIFYNHLRNENDLLQTSSFMVKKKSKIIFEATMTDEHLLGMSKFNLIQKLKELDNSIELVLEIGLMNMYYSPIINLIKKVSV